MLTKLFSRDGPRSLALILLATFACLALAPFLFPDTCSVDTAAMAGSLNAIWLRYVGPDTALSFENMVDILLMVVIGGMGTIYGGVIGATLFILALSHLQGLMGAASDTLA